MRTNLATTTCAAIIACLTLGITAHSGNAASSKLDDRVVAARQLTTREPANAKAQRDLVIVLDQLGDVKMQAGDGFGALGAYEESLAVNRKRVADAPADEAARTDLAVSLDEVGGAKMKAGDQAGALASYAESITLDRTRPGTSAIEPKPETPIPPKAAASESAQQPCGWYAITACKTSATEARAYARRHHTGVVINTSQPGYRNFREGFYCVVSGPTDREVAMASAARWRSSGVSPQAYAKDSCVAAD